MAALTSNKNIVIIYLTCLEKVVCKGCLQEAKLRVLIPTLVFVLKDECIHIIVYVARVSINNYDLIFGPCMKQFRQVLHNRVIHYYTVFLSKDIGEKGP